MKPTVRFLALALLALLAACDSFDVKDTLGLNRKAPDEFRVVSRPPLSVPPEFNLQAPAKGSEYTPPVGSEAQARSKILAPDNAPLNTPLATTAVTPVFKSDLPSSGDAQFLANAGAAKANPHIRDIIEEDKENGTGLPKDNTYLLSGKSTDDPLVDPAKEAERLKQDKAQNKPPTEGETPVITPADKGILGDIF